MSEKSLSEKCPNTEFFLVRIFPHSELVRRDTEYLSVFSPNAGKYGPEETPYLDTFYAVNSITKLNKIAIVDLKHLVNFTYCFTVKFSDVFRGLRKGACIGNKWVKLVKLNRSNVFLSK